MKRGVGGYSRNEGIGRERGARASAVRSLLTGSATEPNARNLAQLGKLLALAGETGLISGFVPAKVGDSLDFFCVHLYPQQGKLKEADFFKLHVS